MAPGKVDGYELVDQFDKDEERRSPSLDYSRSSSPTSLHLHRPFYRSRSVAAAALAILALVATIIAVPTLVLPRHRTRKPTFSTPYNLDKLNITLDELAAKNATVPGSQECAGLDQRVVARLASGTFEPRSPELYVMKDGVYTDRVLYDGPTTFCLLVLVYQPNSETNVTSSPVPGYGPDDLHAIVKSRDTWMTITQFSLYAQYGRTIAYTAPMTLLHPGLYELNGAVDYQNWNWVDNALSTSIAGLNFRPYPASLTIKGETVSTSALPPCFDKNQWIDPSIGRWRKPASATEYGWISLEDYAGWVFTPDYCLLEDISYHRQLGLLVEKKLAIFGDSFFRRALKSFVSEGEFCDGNPTRDPGQCWCEDTGQFEVGEVDFRRIDDTSLPVALEIGDETSVFFRHVGGWQDPGPHADWRDQFFPRLPDVNTSFTTTVDTVIQVPANITSLSPSGPLVSTAIPSPSPSTKLVARQAGSALVPAAASSALPPLTSLLSSSGLNLTLFNTTLNSSLNATATSPSLLAIPTSLPLYVNKTIRINETQYKMVPGGHNLSLAAATVPAGSESPDLLGIGFGIYDSMHGGNVTTYEKDIEVLVRTLYELYPGVPRVVMLAPLNCCTRDAGTEQQWSAMRTSIFNRAVKDVFLRLLPAGDRVFFWDFSHMAGSSRPDMLLMHLCRLAHPDWDKTKMTNQVLFNMLDSLGW
ncbi:hypothetical protein MNV49_000999 [Pseudohyphozyma bogoriensis]|nr:hypothetical protein MNV49_000999 [Pseudohyphozyma bogoriensis]